MTVGNDCRVRADTIRLMKRFFTLFLGTIMLLLGASCSRSPEELASFDSTTLTIDDLTAHLLAQPPNARRIPPDTIPSEWIEERLRRLAIETTLESSEDMERLRSTPTSVSRRLWRHSAALASALSSELARAAEPEMEALKARAEELAAAARNEQILSFRHIFFRSDLATLPSEKQQVRRRAEEVATLAQSGVDFAALAREHSDSANAPTGGLVANARPSDLEARSREAVAVLDEGQVSPVIETRTGLHVFQLVRRLRPQPLPPTQLEARARQVLLGQGIEEARRELVAKLRDRIEWQTEKAPWEIGRWSLDTEVLDLLLPNRTDERARDLIIERFLLAEEARRRGLETPELAAEVDQRVRAEDINLLLASRRAAAITEIDHELLRIFFDGQPSLFSSPATTDLELIFVPQGVDSFTTQQQVEVHVSALRSGASFGELALRVSRGPGAGNGGYLGSLSPQELAILGPAIVAAVPELEVGQVSDSIYCTDRILSQQAGLLRGGFAVLRVRGRQPEQTRSFDEAIEDVRRAYASDHRADIDREIEDRILDEIGFAIVRIPDPAELFP